MSGRVLHVVTALGVGGAEVWLLELLRHTRRLEEAGVAVEEMDILMTGGLPAALDAEAASLGATLHYVPFGRSRFVSFAKEFRKILETRSFTVLHDHQGYSSVWHFLAGVGSLPPVRIVHVHNAVAALRANTDTLTRKVLFEAGKPLLRRMATHILGTSQQLLDEYELTAAQFPDQEIRALHCGFDVEPFAMSEAAANSSVCEEFAWPDRSRICVFAGRLDAVDPADPTRNLKNPAFALDVVRDAIGKGTDVRLIVAGDGEAVRRKLERRVQDWGLSDRIRLVGTRRDMPRLMRASRVCLFPSLQEGLGMAAVEAQAAGLHVLASDTVPRAVAVIDELVTFLPLEAGPSKWAAVLSALLDRPRHDGAAAREAVRNSAFSIENSYAALHSIYSAPDHSR